MKAKLKFYENLQNFQNMIPTLREKFPNNGVFSGPYFPVFGLNTEIYGVNLRIQSEYRKIRTRKNYAFGHFSRSVDINLRLSVNCIRDSKLYTSFSSTHFLPVFSFNTSWKHKKSLVFWRFQGYDPKCEHFNQEPLPWTFLDDQVNSWKFFRIRLIEERKQAYYNIVMEKLYT